jgi:predicted DNA-binding protein YlxM (UPF0122 family)
MYWENIKSLPSEKFKRLTGVTYATFKLMVKEVKQEQDKINKKKGDNRRRPYKLGIEDQILMMLMYYREYRTLFHIGETYGIHESNVSKNIRRIENILKKCKKLELPGKKKLSGTNHQYEVIIVDATESPIERPKKTALILFREKEKAHNKNPNSN